MWKLNHKEGCALKNWIFWTVVLEKTLESPLDCKEIQLPILKKISPEYSLKGLMPEVPIVWPPDSKSLLLEKDPDAGKDWARGEEGNRGWDGWMASQSQRTWVWANSGSWWWTGKPDMLQSMGSQRVGQNWVTEQEIWNWNFLICLISCGSILSISMKKPQRSCFPSV